MNHFEWLGSSAKLICLWLKQNLIGKSIDSVFAHIADVVAKLKLTLCGCFAVVNNKRVSCRLLRCRKKSKAHNGLIYIANEVEIAISRRSASAQSSLRASPSDTTLPPVNVAAAVTRPAVPTVKYTSANETSNSKLLVITNAVNNVVVDNKSRVPECNSANEGTLVFPDNDGDSGMVRLVNRGQGDIVCESCGIVALSPANWLRLQAFAVQPSHLPAAVQQQTTHAQNGSIFANNHESFLKSVRDSAEDLLEFAVRSSGQDLSKRRTTDSELRYEDLAVVQRNHAAEFGNRQRITAEKLLSKPKQLHPSQSYDVLKPPKEQAMIKTNKSMSNLATPTIVVDNIPCVNNTSVTVTTLNNAMPASAIKVSHSESALGAVYNGNFGDSLFANAVTNPALPSRRTFGFGSRTAAQLARKQQLAEQARKHKDASLELYKNYQTTVILL